MDLSHLVVGEMSAYLYIAILKVLEVHLLAFLDEGIYDIDLTALFHLHPYLAVDVIAIAVVHVDGIDGFATRWQFVDDADI